MFVDSDDVLLPGACENAVRLISENSVDVLQFGMKITVLPDTETSEFEKLIRQNNMMSEGDSILHDCYVLHRYSYSIVNKIFRGDLCRAAAETMPDVFLRHFSDLYLSFFLLYRAKTFRSVVDGPYYEYFVGNGISTRSPNEKQFADLCKASAILPAIEWFLKRENALDKKQFLMDSIGTILKTDVVNMLLVLPEITEEIVDLAVKSWGSEVLYDLIVATGLLDVKCNSRYQLVTALAIQARKQSRPPTSAGVITLSVGQPTK